ncbi:uncharacterized protein BXZ73DRAFT_109201 [Epithele typhae]|uniref:uncharacterized protein n=1 Tax=Epithele typhae TaxID=378194 RepID=UPI0020074E4A|nr:uncharacterized protein BXZ73DRAFT_109201 [Epithele typhae]KAH9910283.1 hypothetical protein BXZ73DRAFT_109201 [Epithele typhae]
MDRDLPPEIWRLVLESLPLEDKRTCLFVSRPYYTIVVASLFRHITLHFGLWQPPHIERTSEDLSELVDLNNRTWELLYRISTTPSFATHVRKLNVHFYPEDNNFCIFELRQLEQAIHALAPSLCSVDWFGSPPPDHSSLLRSLAQDTGATLQHLRLPIEVVSNNALVSFTNLRSLILHPDPDHLWDLYHANLIKESTVQSVCSAVSNNAPTLHHLSAVGDLVMMFPPRAFIDVNVLELTHTGILDGLALILRHCERLCDLALILRTIMPSTVSGLSEALVPDTLPFLESFRFNCAEEASVPAVLEVISKFLAGRHILKRLDISPADVEDQFWSGLPPSQPILGMLHTLPSIKALALGFEAEITTETIEQLSSCVPMDINAFRIGGFVVRDYLIENAFLSFVRCRTSLGYLHIFNPHPVGMDYKLQLLEDPPPALELYGFGPYLRWLVPGPDGPDAYPPRQWTEHWPPRKVTFRTVEDFGRADWEWLLRHNGRWDYHSMPPGARVQL